MLKKIAQLGVISTLIVAISGCETMSTLFTAEEVDDNPALVCKIPYDFERPTPIRMNRVKFHVLTPEIMEEIVNGNPNDRPEVYYGLTVDGYESISYNMVEINRYLESTKILIEQLSEYYSNEESDNENGEEK